MWRPVDTLGVEHMPLRLHLRMRRVDRDDAVTPRLIRWHYVEIWPVDVDPDEVEWRCDRLELVVGELRCILAVLFQVLIGVAALEHHGGEVGIQFTSRSLGSPDALGGVHDWNSYAHVFGKAHLCARPAAGADCLNCESVSQNSVMTHLVELAIRQPQPGCPAEVQLFTPTDLHVETLVTGLYERAELINREEVLHSIAELLGDVPAIVGERFRGVLGPPPTGLVLQRLRQIPVIERGKRLDAGSLQLVYQAAVEVETLRVGLTRAFRKDARPRNREPIRVGAGVLHQRNVFLVPVVMVIGDVTCVVVLYIPRLVRIRIPDREALAVLVPCALDLVRRRADAPVESLRECPRPTGRSTWLNIA